MESENWQILEEMNKLKKQVETEKTQNNQLKTKM